MVSYDFWKDWKYKTKIEKKAIRSVENARDLVVRSVPKNKLIAIYIKGSFTRREMKRSSDVDMVPIVTENKYQNVVFGVNDSAIAPVIVVPLSLWELEHNTLWTRSNFRPDLRAKPDRLLKKIRECKCIYGKRLHPKKYPIRDNKTVLKDEIKVIKTGYVSLYKKGKLPFSPLLKEVFWLVELEQNLLGKKVKHSFEGIATSVEDAHHIIHSAFSLRKRSSANKQKEFILKLKEYVKELAERV